MASKKSIDLNWMTPGTKCWVEIDENEKSNDVFRPAQIVSLDATKTKIKLKYVSENKGPEEVKTELIMERSDDKADTCDDMVNMECLNDAELLINLQKRFEKKFIFTYVGPTLLVVNPYQLFPDTFSAQTLEKYQKIVFQPESQLKDFPPHVWALTAESYRQLFELEKNQALVISGESGAGKTENTKYAMKFLTGLGKLEKRKSSIRKSFVQESANMANLGNSKESIEDKILSCNPILEAFGNAKTVRNDNSSRFGKYVRLLVDKKRKIILGARMDNYLLEKSRITSQGKGERNYHIFYHFIKGASVQELEQYGLSKNGKKIEMSSFEYLKKSECYDVPNIKDEALYLEVKESFSTMKFTTAEENAIWSIVASCLQIGNIIFDDSTFDNDKPCQVLQEEYLKTAAKILKIEFAILSKAFLMKTREVGKSIIESPMSKQDCEFARESLAKDLFDKLFVWLVKRLNFTIMPPEDLRPGADLEKLEKERFKIGLLDIFGFEVFKINSLEQFCINYTNEKLQQLYISYVFKAEEKEFINEGLEKYIVDLNFKDNQPVIDLMDLYPSGIYHLIDEVCAVNGTDDSLINKIRTTHKANQKFVTPRLTKDTFIVVHTAKNVEYCTNGFRTKNRDEMSKIVFDAILSSGFPEIIKIFKGLTGNEKDVPVVEEVGKSKKATDKYLGAKFRAQMKDLMTELTSCDCHFIRCIKPNEQKQKELWVPTLTLAQIRYLGVLDSIKVRRDSFPIRRAYRLFYQKYGEIDTQKLSMSKLVETNADFRALTIGLFQKFFPELKTDLVLFGKTKIFLRVPGLNVVERIFNEKIKEKNIKALKIQRSYYRYKQLKKLKMIMRGIRRIQDLWRCRVEYKKFLATKAKIRLLQHWLHKQYLKKQAKQYRESCISIQKYIRRYYEFLKYQIAKLQIIEIQRLIRGGLARKRVRKLKICRQIILECILCPCWERIIYFHATKVQSLVRSFLVKCKFFSIVKQARNVKKTLMENKAARRIQRIGRGYIVRQRLNRLNRAAFYIQGFFKMKWLTAMVKRLRISARIIQRNVRIYMTKKKAIRKRIDSFLFKHKEDFEADPNTESQYLYPDDPEELIKEVTPYDKKIELITYVLDLDLMTELSDVYTPAWSYSYRRLIDEGFKSDSEVQCLKIGGLHTLAITNNTNKVYSWGWNDHFQLGREGDPSIPSQVFFPYSTFKLKMASIGEDHNFLLDYENNLWCWGHNDKGQLGLNHKHSIPIPVKAEIIQKNLKIKEINSRYYTNGLVTECGKTFIWPIEKNNEFYLKPVEQLFPLKTSISSISLGFQFVIFQSNSGLLYSMGNENLEGQLGQGDILPRNNPTLIESLRNSGDKIVSVECGHKHVIAKSSLGKVFTWGWGIYGQLGHNKFNNEISPKLLQVNNPNVKLKALQVHAGYKCSIILLENKKIMWWGTNNSLKKVCLPVELILEKKNKMLNQNDFIPIRVMVSWSKSVSLIYATIADLRNTNHSQAAKHKILSTLHNNWAEVSIKQIDPPFIDSISKNFSGKFMKLNRVISEKKIQPKYPQTFLSSVPGSINQPDLVFDLKRDSFIPYPPLWPTKDERFISDYNSPDFQGNYTIGKEEEKNENIPEENNQNILDINTKISSNKRLSAISSKENARKSFVDKNFEIENKKRNSQISQVSLKENKISENFNNNNNKIKSNSRVSFGENEIQHIPKQEEEKISQEMEKKLQTIKNKYDKILKKPKENWTEVDHEFIKIATDPKMQQLLSKLTFKNA